MEDEDEFGDLYTDVLKPFSSTSTTSSATASAAPQHHQPSPTPANVHRPIDLNVQSQEDDISLFGGSRQIPATQTLAPFKSPSLPPAAAAVVPDSIPRRDSAPKPMVLDSKQEANDGKDVKFDIEEGGSNGIEDVGSDDPIIPGLTESVCQEDSVRNNNGNDNGIREGEAEAEGEGDDWDSDSEDDLQIVLNDNNHGPMAMERGGMMGEDDDEDGDALVIVADGDANQGVEEQEWGEEGGQVADGERKEGGEAGKVGGGASGGGSVVPPKVGYSNHGYHPFHSQFKYVRPGAAPMPGATTGGPGGAPGQVRPLMGAMSGRGRGDWRPPGMKAAPPMQKGFHTSFGMPGWGNNMAGRGFGGGLEFTLPSHKTIFDVDIDSFEEKPWKYPGVDLSDFFNFGLNEESWKDYCKQLEQHRLETTMQSKIRVYESGRTEQDYDPDLPPELAAATGQEVPADAANLAKSDGGQHDVTKGTARVRPPVPTGRAIQVEGGYGERLPSIDTRPPRIRDSDAIIEIVCQDTLDDDSSIGNVVVDQTENDLPRGDLRGDLASEADVAREDAEYFDGFPDAYNSQKREVVGRRTLNSVQSNEPEDGILPFPAEASLPYGPGSRGQSPMYSSGNFSSPRDERHQQGRAHERSPRMTPIQGRREKFSDAQKEESVESMDAKSPDAREISVERKDDVDDELDPADGNPVTEKDEQINETHEVENSPNPMKNEKRSSHGEQRMLQELDDDEDSRAARSSENSKARSGSSRDYQKWRDGAEEEVVQGGRLSRMGIVKKHLDEHDQNFRRKDREGRHEIERNRMVGKPGEDSYPLRDFDASLSHNLHTKAEGFDRRRERDNPDGTWQRREDDLYNRKSRTEDLRKRERDDEMGSRNRAKIRESERSDKDDYPHSRKQLDNGSFKVHHDKDVSARHRERDDNLKSRYEAADDYQSKRRKDEEYLRRDHADKEEILHGHRESSSSRRKRERDEITDQRKRNERPRIRDNFDEHHSVRHKDEVWLHRERVERQRERDEWHRLKQSHDESLPKREREEVRGIVRSGRGSEDKAWVAHTRAKDEYKGSEKEYQLKETVRHSEQVKRRERNDDESFSRHRGREDSYARGHQFGNEERRSRQERSSTRNDHAANASDSQRGEKKHKENTRKDRESEGGDPITLGSAKRNQEDLSGQNNETGLKSGEKNENPAHYNSSRKHKEDASSDDEQQESKRGRSKLERWTSHKERDYSINSKSSASLKFKEIEKINNVASSESNKIPDERGKSIEPAENHHPLSEDKGVGEPEIKDADIRPLEDRHLDTVEKLKKRSERFKLPMPSEKDALAIKKMESEALPSAKNETPADSEIKPERPARKRRWISN
ncbi:PREDICTED: FIP1[V]-like protein [Theobroma cacao]|uniref:FIP1[V]-like protein n=1 Tax=Theobroma cacao TaxID=3641 RepID=A0AB32UNN0_THECC|nr:PREDICTED: FIP1[V]-like protein [Theobroma cacao]